MKRRVIRWIQSKLITYIPSSSSQVTEESNRLSDYICEKYNGKQRLIMVENILKNVIRITINDAETLQKSIDEDLKTLEKLKWVIEDLKSYEK